MVTRLLKKTLLFLACIFSLSASFAQTGNTISGYAYLGSCNDQYGRPHYYYVSEAALTWPAANSAAMALGPVGNKGYLATLTTLAENNCVYANLVTYLNRPGGPGLVPLTNPACTDPTNDPLYRPCSPWNDDRHPWIGYTDAVSEGATESNFIFTNGESACSNFNNWDIGEPNNFGPAPGEDYVQLLAYVPHGNPPANQIGGRWNDWFNSESQTYIVEFGPSSCTPPPPPADRGNNGCSHGYYKKGPEKPWTDAGYSRNQSFVMVFGITNNRGVVTNTTSLDASLDLKGGGYNQVAKQGTAALLNAGHGFYPYTEGEIKTAVSNMFNTGMASLPMVTVNGTTYTGGTWNSPEGLASYLDKLNNLGCPLNNAGELRSVTARELPISEAVAGLSVRALSNPASGSFTIQIGSASADKLSYKVMDMQGKLVEQRQNMAANQTLRFGNNLRPGIYFLEVMQGAERKQLKLVKSN